MELDWSDEVRINPNYSQTEQSTTTNFSRDRSKAGNECVCDTQTPSSTAKQTKDTKRYERYKRYY